MNEQLAFHEQWRRALVTGTREVPVLPGHWVAHHGADLCVIDLRPKTDVEGVAGYIPGSTFFPDLDADAFDSVPRGTPLVLVSASGHESYRLAKDLLERGFTRVASLDGGIMGYRALGNLTSRDQTKVEYTTQLEALMQRTRTDFASGDSARPVELSDIEEHLGDGHLIPWMKAATILSTGSMQCIDGRDRAAVVGCPGGDLGQLLLVLCAYENLTGDLLSEATVGHLFARRLDAFGGCYLHTDVAAEQRLLGALQSEQQAAPWRATFHDPLAFREFFLRPPQELRPLLLDLLTVPEHLGCGHLKAILVQAERYEARPALVRHLLKAFFVASFADLHEPQHVVLSGAHAERAVLQVVQEDPIQPWSGVPLVSPQVGENQLFVLHADVAAYFRQELVQFVSRQTDVVASVLPSLLHQEVERLSAHRNKLTLSKLAAGLPLFQATFRRDGGIRVEALGTVAAD